MKFISLILAILISFGLQAREIKGKVEDLNGNKISDVVVSDGLNTTTTDKNGKYILKVDEDSRFVFISTPSGYESITLKNIDDKLLFYKELNEAKTYNFLVKKKDIDDTKHRLIAIADPQINDRPELKELKVSAKDIAEEVAKNKSAYTFGLVLGDIVGWDHRIYPDYDKIMATTGIEYRYVIGNHDMTNYGRSHETSFEKYEDHYGPAWYSFNVGKVHYVVLNDSFFIGRDWYYIGYIDERQLKWLENDLSYVPEGYKLVLAMHIPTTLGEDDREKFAFKDINEILCNKQALYEIVKPWETMILSGHMHSNTNQVINDKLMEHNIAALSGAWYCGPICIDGSPPGYKIFDFDGTEVEWVYKGVNESKNYQMKVYVDAPGHEDYIVVNIWDYDPEWKVEYYEYGNKVSDLERFTAPDPQASQVYNNNDNLKRAWVWAPPTPNLFRVRKPAANTPWEIIVTDRFGRIYQHHHN